MTSRRAWLCRTISDLLDFLGFYLIYFYFRAILPKYFVNVCECKFFVRLLFCVDKTYRLITWLLTCLHNYSLESVRKEGCALLLWGRYFNVFLKTLTSRLRTNRKLKKNAKFMILKLLNYEIMTKIKDEFRTCSITLIMLFCHCTCINVIHVLSINY